MNIQVFLIVWDTSSWAIEKETESKFDAMVISVHDMSIVKLEKGWEVVWPVIFQINFWNLNTGVERVALKSVGIASAVMISSFLRSKSSGMF